jgi:hypothetical protein
MSDAIKHDPCKHGIFSHRVCEICHETEQLELELAELRRKLAEQQALNHGRTLIGWMRGYDFIALPEMAKKGDIALFTIAIDGAEELNKLISAAKQEGYEQGKQSKKRGCACEFVEMDEFSSDERKVVCKFHAEQEDKAKQAGRDEVLRS